LGFDADTDADADAVESLKDPAGTFDAEDALQPAKASAPALVSTTDIRVFLKIMGVQVFLE